MGGFWKCNISDFSRLVHKPSTLMNSKEIGMFKVLFLCLGRFCQSIFFPVWLKSLEVTEEITKF